MIVRQRYTTPTLDQKFEQVTRSFFDTAARPGWPAARGTWVDDQYVITVDLPGVPAEAVSVDVVGDQLHLGVDNDEVSFDRKLRLDGKLDGDKVTARHVDGRLTITIGQVDEPEARRVEIDTTPVAPAIETTDSETATGEAPLGDNA